MARYDDLNTNAIAYTTFISCVILAVTILLVQALCYNWLNSTEELRVGKESYQMSDETIAAQRGELKEYRWIEVPAPLVPGAPEPKAGEPQKLIKKLQIPLERATQLLLEDLGKAAHPET